MQRTLPTPTTSGNEQGFSIWCSIDSKVSQIQPSGTNTSRAIIEVKRYLEDNIQNRNTDALKWWMDNKHNYPYLSQLAGEHFAVLVHQCPVNGCSLKLGYSSVTAEVGLVERKLKCSFFLIKIHKNDYYFKFLYADCI